MKLKSIKKREIQKEFKGRVSENGLSLNFGTYTRIDLKKFMKENPNMPIKLCPILVESKDQRGFFEGAICPLMTFYQEGMDFHNSKDIRKVREWLKIEFLGELVSIKGKVHRIAQSTKNKLSLGFLERVEGYLIDNYAPPEEIFDTNKYNHWRDAIFPYGGPDNYLDYLIELNILNKLSTCSVN